jgi:hypothetical protein
LDYEHIFLARTEHIAYYDLDALFFDIGHKVYPVGYTTSGAAITVLIAGPAFTEDEDVLIVNSDQLVDFDPGQIEEVRSSGLDGCIWCFEGHGPNWSYVKLDDNGLVSQVAEKKQISNIATGGMYYWKSFRAYIDATRAMTQAEDKTNGEYYVAPVYNHMPLGSKIGIRMLDNIEQLGTPEELEAYVSKVRIY